MRDGRSGPPVPFLCMPFVNAGSLHGLTASSSSSSLSALRLSMLVLLPMTDFDDLVVMLFIDVRLGKFDDEDASSRSGEE